MRTHRREFTKADKAAMNKRATDEHGQIRCEGCGLALKMSEIEHDHIIAEALRPEEDKRRKITPAEGQVLGRDCCHRGKDSKTSADQKKIAKAKRGEQKHLGIVDPPKMESRGFQPTRKSAERRAKAEQKIDFTQRRNLYRSA